MKHPECWDSLSKQEKYLLERISKMKAAEPKINFHELQRIISVYSAFISAGLKEYHSKKLSIISKVKEENNFFEDLEE